MTLFPPTTPTTALVVDITHAIQFWAGQEPLPHLCHRVVCFQLNYLMELGREHRIVSLALQRNKAKQWQQKGTLELKRIRSLVSATVIDWFEVSGSTNATIVTCDWWGGRKACHASRQPWKAYHRRCSWSTTNREWTWHGQPLFLVVVMRLLQWFDRRQRSE